LKLKATGTGSLIIFNDVGGQIGSIDNAGSITWGDPEGKRFVFSKSQLYGANSLGVQMWGIDNESGGATFQSFGVSGLNSANVTTSGFGFGRTLLTDKVLTLGSSSPFFGDGWTVNSDSQSLILSVFSDETTSTTPFSYSSGEGLVLTSGGGIVYFTALANGNGSFAGNLNVVGGLQVGGPAQFAGGTIAVNGFTVVGNATVTGILNVGGLVASGVTDTSNASSGKVGEVISAAVTSTTSLSNGTAANTTGLNLTLTAGDWDVEGNVNFTLTGATVTQKTAGLSTISATLPTDGTQVFNGSIQTLITGSDSVVLPRKRINVSASTTLYVVAKSSFSAGTVVTFGSVTARRVR
jgi:hypothetical protein